MNSVWRDCAIGALKAHLVIGSIAGVVMWMTR